MLTVTKFYLTISGTNIKVKKTTSVHVLGVFNLTDIDWADRLNKLGSALSQSEGQMLTDIMNDHGLEQLVHFPTREREKKIHWIYYSLLFLVSFRIFTHRTNSAYFDIVAGTLKVVIPPIKKPRRKVYLYQKGDYEMHLNLQRKNISTVIQIFARYMRTLTWLVLLFKIRGGKHTPSNKNQKWDPKLVGRYLRFPGLPWK